MDFKGPHRVGRYGVDIKGFERFLGRLVLEAPVLLIDEIGKMECLSQKFRVFIEKLLSTDKQVIATIAQHGTPFIESLKRIQGTRIIQIKPGNREALPVEIFRQFNG